MNILERASKVNFSKAIGEPREQNLNTLFGNRVCVGWMRPSVG